MRCAIMTHAYQIRSPSDRERGRGEDLRGLPNASAPNLLLSASSQMRVSIASACLVVRPLPEYAKNGVNHD